MSPEQNPLNRRQEERFRINGSATLHSTSSSMPSIIEDISCQGAGIINSYPLRINEKVEILMHSSVFKEPLARKAIVVWCNQIEHNLWKAGLNFPKFPLDLLKESPA